MLKSLPDVFRSFWSKSANDNKNNNSSCAVGLKRKREDTEWDEDPDVQIVKVEKRRKTDSFWNFFNLPSKMSDWMKPKQMSFSDEFATTRVSNRNVRDIQRNGAPNRIIPHLNGNKHPDSFVQKSDARPVYHSHNRGILNGQLHQDFPQDTSRHSDRASSTNTFSKPWKNSTSSMCIRLSEKEKYHKLLRMQMIHSRLTPSPPPWNSHSPPVESDTLSMSSNNSSNDVSLLGTSQCLTQIRHNRDSIPQYKTTPRKSVRVADAPSSSLFPRCLKSTKPIPESLTSIIARQKRRAGFRHQSQSQMETKNPPKPVNEVQLTVISDDDDDVCIIDDNVEEDNKRLQDQHSKDSISSSEKSRSHIFLNSKYARDGYLQEMQKSRLMHSEQWKRQVEEEEMKAKAYEQKRLAQSLELERRLKHQMRIFSEEPEVSEEIFAESEDEEEEEEEDESLPDLTDDMMQVVRGAMRPNPPGEVLSEGFSIKITRGDVATLGGLNWLNDEIINFYLNMLIDRGKQDSMPNVYAFNTFFYPKIMSGGHSTVKRWTKKVDIFDMNYILIPVHLKMHWCLCVANMKDKVITYYDSMGGRNGDCLKAVLKYINDESVIKKQTPINESEWTLDHATDNPHQMNGGDCGMFACKYAEYLTRGKRISFTQNDMPYFRLRMVYEIVKRNLLQ